MFEFARADWLWLFLLTLLFCVAYVLARRFRATRATYGQVWHAVARKLRPPAWKRLLRTLLTWLIALALIASVVLYAAGMQRPQADKPPPLLVAIVVDCTPSMAAKAGENTRRKLAWARAHEILKALGPDDRAVVFHFERGFPMSSRWLSHGDMPAGPPPTDFAQPDLAALAESVRAMQPPPGMANEPAPVRFIWWLGDKAPTGESTKPPPRLAGISASWLDLHGVATTVETFGEAVTNDAITSVRWTPTPQGPGRGSLEFETRSGEGVTLHGSHGGVHYFYESALKFELAANDENTHFGATATGKDALEQDDGLSFTLPAPPLARAHIAWPAADGEINPNLRDALALLLPGVSISAGASNTEPDRHELLVCDRAVPEDPNARFMLCFGATSAKFGSAGTPIRVAPGLQRGTDPGDLGFELPDLSLLQGDDVVPLTPADGMRPLLKAPTGEVLIAEGSVDNTRILYSGFTPHRSTMLMDPGSTLLLMRWLAAARAGNPNPWPPVIQADASIEGTMQPAAKATLNLRTTPWHDASGDRAFSLTAAPDGRAKLGPLVIAGEWLLQDSAGHTPITALWRDTGEQALPFEALPRANLAALHPTIEPDWRDHFPAVLLWIALGLLVLEWLLWLVGVTE